ncbi:hypothetical protein J6590_036753 [Homalodisca vitripennis]|nr:hypothetical protein J6590_036753 [Homalodisca vitripennis]
MFFYFVCLNVTKQLAETYSRMRPEYRTGQHRTLVYERLPSQGTTPSSYGPDVDVARPVQNHEVNARVIAGLLSVTNAFPYLSPTICSFNGTLLKNLGSTESAVSCLRPAGFEPL